MARPATCPLCEASCGILVDADAGKIGSIRGGEADPFSRGDLCSEGSSWREVSWEEALDRAADRLVRIRKQYGRDAIGMYYGNPVAHNLGLMTHALPFARALGTRQIYSASSADQLPQMLA